MTKTKTSIAYAPRLDATPQTELSTLANVYRFVLDCHAKKKPPGPGAAKTR